MKNHKVIVMFRIKSHNSESIIRIIAQWDIDRISMSYRENISDNHKPEVPLGGADERFRYQ